MYNENHKKAALKYRKKACEQLNLLLPVGTRARWRAQAEHNGETLQAMIKRLVDEEIHKNGT